MSLPDHEVPGAAERSAMFDGERTPPARNPTLRTAPNPARRGDPVSGEATAGQTAGASKRIHQGVAMKGFVQDIEHLATRNDAFRQVLYTARSCHLVLMALQPNEEIGAEVHGLAQFFGVEQGSGEVVLDGVRTPMRAGFAVLVPAGAKHNIINTGAEPLKLYTLYAPPNHRAGVVHRTRADAEADNEHFDGKTSE
jgi:mannose-6-phosphate isomerase-like protein (cupin superfamily)